MNKFTPGLWKAYMGRGCWMVDSPEADCIAEVYSAGIGTSEANANRIVQCANNFDALLTVCRNLYRIMLDGMTDDYDYMTEQLGKAKAAIDGVTGEQNDE